ncbi:hypothetical protein SynA1560_01386 [Synechococcus sp. A15-60]|nr:hypothetical protein SynA1560_01386 [Synechococcus sp. A15-60]
MPKLLALAQQLRRVRLPGSGLAPGTDLKAFKTLERAIR